VAKVYTNKVRKAGTPLFSFAIIADTHFMPDDDGDSTTGYINSNLPSGEPSEEVLVEEDAPQTEQEIPIDNTGLIYLDLCVG